MENIHLLALSVVGIAISSNQIAAQDLSTYHDFHVGMSLAAVATQTNLAPEPRVILERPALIQELTWQPQGWLRSTRDESVKKIQFAFYNGQLFRLVVTYDRDKTEGLTEQDMIGAISATYGRPLLPATPLPSVAAGTAGSQSLDYSEKPVASWGDSEHSIVLFQSPYGAGFGLAVRSTAIDVLAQAAMVEGARLDAEEAPQREIERQQKAADDKRLRSEAARRANKQAFQP